MPTDYLLGEMGQASTMIYDNHQAISTFDALIRTCKDGEQGFRTAADGVNDPSELRQLFLAHALERARFAGELQAEVRRIGADPEESGSLSGAMHRGWMNIKAAVTGRDEAAILAECEAGEASTLKAYDEALTAALGPQQRDIVSRQRADIQKAHDKIRGLRNTPHRASRAA